MVLHLITSLLSLCSHLLPSIPTSASASASAAPSASTDDRRAFQHNLHCLVQTLQRIRATLYDAQEERHIRDRSVHLWLKELKRLAYDVEDVLSEYRYEATRLQVEAAAMASQAAALPNTKQIETEIKLNYGQCVVPIPDGMVNQLIKIRNQFDMIAKDREALRLRKSDGARRQNKRIMRCPTGHMVDEETIFGRDREIMEVVDLLLAEREKPFSVISIIGKGGLGKTTIAQLVYKNARVRKCFDLFGWVCVSEEFEVSKLTKATIESISNVSSDVSELSPLQKVLAESVNGKKLLLVLDDVWNENQNIWELFKFALKGAKLVRTLVTTRNEKVSKIMLTTTCFRPNYLPEDSCWQLFQHYAFGGSSHTVPAHFVDMGREIMRKCRGLPLAVKSIASLLRHEADEESWREILESDLWENPSIDIFPALQISYAHLPAHLKPCFIFCSMYPKDYALEKMNLIELWISLGYIKSRGKRRITEIGVQYYEELKERSFLDQFSYKSEFCKLHDIIHDLARLNSEKEHYSVVINQLIDTNEENIPQEAYHLYVSGFTGFVNQIPEQKLKGLRTLSTDLRGCRGSLENQYCINMTEAIDLYLMQTEYSSFCFGNTIISDLTKFEALRVMELKGHCLRKIPDSIAQLKHLSHLRITSDCLVMLPLSIGLLYNLQTFFLDCWGALLENLPESIGQLANLQCLHIKCAHLEKLPTSLCSLTNLQRLVFESYNLEKLPSNIKNLCNLQELIINSKLKSAFPNTIGCLSSLEELHLPVMGTPSELPRALGNCCKLITLKTHDSFLNYNPQGLENFPVMRRMTACLKVRTIAWLKDMKDLQGDLNIEGLENMNNLVDAKHANLRSKCRIENLKLCWHTYCEQEPSNYYGFIVHKELTIKLIEEPDDQARQVDTDMSFGLLECLQPHSHLKKLTLGGYPSATLSSWMSDPSSLQAIQEITLQGCDGLQSLSFSNLHTLKYLQVYDCSGIRLLQLEQLPSHLEELKISWCKKLELITGLRNLKMLATLQITDCEALESIKMDELQLAEAAETFGNFIHKKPHDRNTSLTRLEILWCPLLCALPDESCNVWVYGCGCPDLKIWS